MTSSRVRGAGEGRRLRVGFDGRALTSPAAGIRRYTRELVQALSALDMPPELLMLGGSENARPAGVAWLPEPPHPPTNAGWMIVGLPLAVRRAGIDVLHAPAYTAPFWSPVPVVLTIHDVSYARHPEWFPYRRDWLRRLFYRRCALSADLVITDSAFSADEIHAAYAIARDRIAVIPLGVNAAFTTPRLGAALPAGVRHPYVLHVGDLHDRRNLAVVMRAVLDARRSVPALAHLSLVLAGIDRGLGATLQQLASEAGAPGAVVLLGSVRDSALPSLYAQACALVYPSLYEGFGLPLIEAMASGTPVIASTAASIPEVVGSAGLLVDPHASQAWSAALVRVATDPVLADRLRAEGRARAAGFTWARTARLTMDVYRRAAGELGPPL